MQRFIMPRQSGCDQTCWNWVNELPIGFSKYSPWKNEVIPAEIRSFVGDNKKIKDDIKNRYLVRII